MLIGVGGTNSKGESFNILPKELTDVFSKEEEARYIDSGQAEAVKSKAKK